MFAVIDASDSNAIFRKPKIKSQRINTPDGEAFFIVTAEKHLGRIPWKKLGSCLGILKKDIILKDGLPMPEGSDITAFSPDIFPRLLLINSAVSYIMKHSDSYKSKSLTIYDEKALYKSSIEKLLFCFSSIKIVTPEFAAYEKLSHKLMESYGLSLLVTDTQSYDSDVIISHRQTAPLYFGGTVFTNEGKPLMSGRVLTGKSIILPEEYENLNTCNIDPLLFASALYEKCGCLGLGTLKYNEMAPLIP